MRISVVGKESENWDREIKQIERDINCTIISAAIREAPFKALLGYLPRLNKGNLRLLTETYRPQNKIQNIIRQEIIETQARYQNHYNRNRHVNVKFNVGDIVYI